uniref:Protein bassoon-like n=1 Tax=Dermatophagoides pteronyssinus TaxID=6956 RepID=A0A6P6XUQ5_DERPT|nr:protein bassoon-like [Dermatophagoides pteronyssinus]
MFFHIEKNVSATIFRPLVDVKGNDAIRQIRVLYDLHDTSSMKNSIKKFNTRMTFDEQRKFFNKPIPNVLYPWTTGQRILINHHHHHHHQHPEKHFIYNRQSSSQPSSSSSLAMKSKDLSIIQLQRGRPMFTEIDFIPRYIPEWTSHVAISVTLPAHIRGKPWILGYHQEQFPSPNCRLCTNSEQSYTVPVTLFLPDDGWCPEGGVQTIWKIEALQQQHQDKQQQQQQQQQQQRQQQTILNGEIIHKNPESFKYQRQIDQTDLILAYGYDELKQIYIKNSINSTICRDIHEAIVA